MSLALVLTDISYRYASKPEPALQGVSLEIPEGLCTGVLGPNGAGKSTLLSIMVGLLDPLTGSLCAGDGAQVDKQALKQRCAIVPQEYAFYPALTSLENLNFFAGLYGFVGAQKRERIDVVTTICGLQHVLRTPAERYSGGLKRRLNLAIGLLCDPAILFLDEPTVGIDAQSRHFILEAIKKLRDAGKTIVYTSHYMEEIEVLCDRIVVIDHGRLLIETPLKALLNSSEGTWVRIRTSSTLTAEQLAQCGTAGRFSQEDGQLMGFINPQTSELAQLLQTLNQMGVVVEEVHYGASRLEDIYLSLTKTALRD